MQYRTSSFIVGAVVIILLFALLSFGTYWLYQKVVSRPTATPTPRPINLPTPTAKPSGFVNPTPTPSPATGTTPQTGGGAPAQLPATGLSGEVPGY